MKKIIIVISLILILTGCNIDNTKEKNISNTTINDEINIPKEEIYTDNNNVKVALYQGKNKVTSYNTTLSNFKDIGTFQAYYTDIDYLDSSNIKYNYQKYYNMYENINNHKTGFYISFEAEGKTIEQLILDPSSKHAMTPYLYVYLYDGVNQKDGAYYSHLEKENMKENTIISSIKLFLAQEGSKISSPITFTVFTYDDMDDFTEDNKYRGNSNYTTTIKTKWKNKKNLIKYKSEKLYINSSLI